MNVTFISTKSHNVGDDFVREGLQLLLRSVIGQDASFQSIHKHLPITTRRELEWMYSLGVTKFIDKLPGITSLGLTRRLDEWLPHIGSSDKILSSDLVVQSGAPGYWLNRSSCADNEWYPSLIEKRWKKMDPKPPLLNLAVGTCQPYESDGDEILQDQKTCDYIRKFYESCSLTTVRDQLSKSVLSSLSLPVEALPCSSIFASECCGFDAATPEYVALNYMPEGGHYLFNQSINSQAWARTFREVALKLSKDNRCILVCHNEKERDAARRLLPELELYFSKNFQEILHFYRSARYGVMNRVHGAFAIANYGRPSIIIGADSRARMAEMIGLESIFVGDADVDTLTDGVARLEASVDGYARKFELIKKNARDAYISLLRSTIL